jgi:hypothetical protein
MSYETERVNITTAFKNAWEAGSNLPVQWENITFDPPANGDPFVAVSIINGQSAQSGMIGGGQAQYRHPGVLQIDISIAKGKGTKVARLLVDEVATIFRGQIVSGIVFRAPAVRRMLEPETSRVRFIVSFTFHRDETL